MCCNANFCNVCCNTYAYLNAIVSASTSTYYLPVAVYGSLASIVASNWLQNLYTQYIPIQSSQQGCHREDNIRYTKTKTATPQLNRESSSDIYYIEVLSPLIRVWFQWMQKFTFCSIQLPTGAFKPEISYFQFAHTAQRNPKNEMKKGKKSSSYKDTKKTVPKRI